MNRASLLLLAAALVVAFVAAYIWLTGGGGAVALPRLDPALGPVASAAMVGLLAGFIGAAIANRFNIGRRGLDAHVERLLKALEGKTRDASGPRSASQRPPADPAAGRSAELQTDSYRQFGGEPKPRPEPLRWPSAESPGRPSAVAAPEASRPLAATPNLDKVSAAYGRVIAGHISRSAFADFFETIGRARPVEIADGGRSIEAASGGESFLTSVDTGPVHLVFPSYDFIANQATQFATIASVPENVAAVFALERGDGELSLDRPAVYENSETGPRLVSKGQIRGFGG
jgi:hypothetical protein